MKKLILSVITALFLTTTMNAVENEEKKIIENQLKFDLNNTEAIPDFKLKNSNVQGFDGTDFFSEAPYWGFTTSNPIQPIAYDPLTNTTFIVASERIFGDGLTGTRTNVYRFDENSQLTDTLRLDLNDSYISLHPSIAVANSNESAESILETEFVTYTAILGENIDGLPEADEGGIFTFYSPSFGSIIEQVETAPNTTVSNIKWSEMQLKNNYNAGNNLIYGWGVFDHPDALPNYGFMKFDFTDFQSDVPQEWRSSEFYTADLQEGFYRHSDMQMDNDNDGNLYAGVLNVFVTNNSVRLAGVSKSTDNGLTWDEFNKMPANILNIFLDSFDDYNSQDDDIAYSGIFSNFFDFTVTAEDEWQFYTLLTIVPGDEEREQRAFIVEISHSNNSWTISQVAELESYGPGRITNFNPDNDSNKPFYDEVLYGTALNGNQVQVSRTIDGDKLVLMWIDINVDREKTLSEPIPAKEFVSQNNYNDIEIESLFMTDIYAAVKDLNTGEWSDPVNLTNDDEYEKHFHIPDYTSSVKDVPFVSVRAPANTDFNNDNIRSYPQEIINMAFDLSNVFVHSRIDATTEAVSVEKQPLNFNVTLGNVTPNPASDKIDIPLTLEQPADIKIEIFNTLGQKVLHVFDGYKQNGVMTVNADISDLQNGTYYYSLTVQGQKFTKVLNIVR